MRRWYSLALFVPLLAFACKQPPPPKPDVGLPLVTVSKPYVDRVTEYTDLTGYTDASATVELRPRVSGFIKKILFKDGQDVTAGDPLVEIDTAPYLADLKKSEGDLATGKAQLKYSESEVARNFRGMQSGAITREEYEKSVAGKGVAEANILTAQGAIDRAKLNLEWCKVTAPITGKIDRALLTEGNVVTGGLNQGTILTTIVSMDPMYAYFDVDDQTVLFYQRQIRAGRLRKASEGEVVIEMALKGETGYPHEGRIDFVSNRISPSTGSLQIRGSFKNEDRVLYPGLFARARVPISQPAEAVLVPDAAVISEQARKLIYIVNDKGVIEARPVKLGPMFRGLRIVEEGLTKDDRVVIKGMQRVRPKVAVEVEDGKITPMLGLPELPRANDAKEKS